MTATAADLFALARRHGITLEPKGDRLRMRAPAPPPPEVVEQLRAAKPELLKILRGTDWDGDDWRDWIAERAGVLEHDGGLPRSEADRRAFEHALIEWLNRHPLQDEPGRCAGCGDPIHDQANNWRPLGDGSTVHYGGAWGMRCIERHGLRRRKEAAAALAMLGIGETPN